MRPEKKVGAKEGATDKREEDSSLKEGLLLFTKEMAAKLSGDFFHNLADRIKTNVEEKVDETLNRIRRATTLAFLLAGGVVFVLVGLAKMLERVLNYPGTGFLFLGLFLLLMGVLFELASRK